MDRPARAAYKERGEGRPPVAGPARRVDRDVPMLRLAAVCLVLALVWLLLPDPGAGQSQRDVKPVVIDGQRTMKYLQQICDIGPRMSGTPGMKRQIQLIVKHFEAFDCKITKQTFEAR